MGEDEQGIQPERLVHLQTLEDEILATLRDPY
jgi:hypothetical protein